MARRRIMRGMASSSAIRTFISTFCYLGLEGRTDAFELRFEVHQQLWGASEIPRGAYVLELGAEGSHTLGAHIATASCERVCHPLHGVRITRFHGLSQGHKLCRHVIQKHLDQFV